MAVQLLIGMVICNTSRLRIIEQPYYDTVSWNDGNNHASKDGQRTTDERSKSRGQACLHYALQGERRRKSDDFVLTHMTGMHQSKQEYIRAIASGTLYYYSAEHEQMEIKVCGNNAKLTGRSRVNSSCFWRRTSHLEVAASFQPFQGRRQVVFYICTCFEILKRTTITRRFADYMHFGEFPFELSAVISKCDFVISDTIF